jgi:amidase
VRDYSRAVTSVDASADDALGSHDVMELLHRLKRREVSGGELDVAARARIDAVNRNLNAVACEVAEASRPGPFAGIPSAVKDNQDLAGYPTRHGSAATPETAAVADMPFVEHLRRLGLTPIVKTTLPEFGLTASTESTTYGATRNPWNVGHSAGGSSGGSAALVAAGALPIAHANDGGGSIRIPAAVCGLVGLKPTRGRFPDRADLAKLPVHIVNQGVLTRTVRDTAYFFAESERQYAAPHLPPVGMVVRPERQRLRVGLLTRGLTDMPVDRQTIDAVRRSGETLADLGHDVTEIEPPVGEQFGRDFLRYWAMLSFMMQRAGGRVFGPGFQGERTESLTKGLASMFVEQAERVPASLRRLRRLAALPEPIYESVDLVVSPVVGHPAPPIGYLGPDVPVREQLVRILRFASFTAWQNVTGAPAMSLPLGRAQEGLPIGVQLAAPRGEERRLLSVAYELEAAMPWPLTPGAIAAQR